jgi:hypothetical protein
VQGIIQEILTCSSTHEMKSGAGEKKILSQQC